LVKLFPEVALWSISLSDTVGVCYRHKSSCSHS